MSDFKIVEYDEFAAKLDELKDTANFLPDVSTDEGYDKSKRIHLDFRKIENKIEKVRKDKKAYFIEGGKQVDVQAKALMAKIEEMRLPHTQAYQELDRLKKEREAKRKQELEDRVAFIRDLPETMKDHSSDEILLAMESLNAEQCEDFYEYTQEALKCRNKSKALLADLYAATKKKEEEAEELERLRKEAAERAQKEREEAIRKEASEKAEREKQEAIERERKAKEAEIAAKQAAIEAEERRKQEAIEAEERRKQAEIEAAEKARLAEIARQEAEKKAEEEAERKRAKKPFHKSQIMGDAKIDLITQCELTEDQAKAVVKAICNGLISHTSIKF